MARTIDGKDVIIRLVAIGDEGRTHLPILRIIATPASVAAKTHALPLLQEMEKDGMFFAVFPLVHSAGYEYDDRMPWFKRVSEVLDAMEQLLSVSAVRFSERLACLSLGLMKQIGRAHV